MTTTAGRGRSSPARSSRAQGDQLWWEPGCDLADDGHRYPVTAHWEQTALVLAGVRDGLGEPPGTLSGAVLAAAEQVLADLADLDTLEGPGPGSGSAIGARALPEPRRAPGAGTESPWRVAS